MPHTPQLNVGDHVVDARFFAEHPDAIMYVRWATTAECEAQQLPSGTALIVMRRSPADREYMRVWCRPAPGQPLHSTLAVFSQLPTMPTPADAPGEDPSRGNTRL